MKKGERKREEILDCAVELLVETGYSELSFRKVAQRAGIQVGNLQFYFPNRASLMEAMLNREIARYKNELSSAKDRADAPPGDEELLRTVDYLLRDQSNQTSCILFWELWALAAHDATAASIMNAHYKTYLDAISDLVQRARPALVAAKADACALLIVSLIEGASLFRGFQKPDLPALKTSKQDIKAAVVAILDQAEQ